MPSLAPITPGNSIAITVAATSAAVAIPGRSAMTQGADQVYVTSLAANAVAFVAFGISTMTVVIPTGTAANGIPILPGTSRVFTVPPGYTHIATIGTAGNTLYVTVGDGQ